MAGVIGFGCTRRGGSRGFTLIELLIVVAIIGIISAIAIPRLLHALQSARQKRTQADMRTLAQIIAIYQQDNTNYPLLADGTVSQIRQYLVPHASGNLVEIDGWQQPIRYQSSGIEYTLISFGANYAADEPYITGPTRRFRDDIIVASGAFVQWPEGVQGD